MEMDTSVDETKEFSLSSSMCSNSSPNKSKNYDTGELRQAAEKLSNDIASTINSLSATLMPQSSEESKKTAGKGIANPCWVVPSDDDAAAKASQRSDSKSSTGSKSKQSPDPTRSSSPYSNSKSSPMARMRDNSGQESSPAPSTPSRRKKEQIKEAWKRKAKKAQQLQGREQEDQQDQEEEDCDDDDDDYEDDDEKSRAVKSRASSDLGMLDPIFNAAMTFTDDIPRSRKEFMDMLNGKCGTTTEDASTDSESSNDYSDYDSYSTPQSRSPRRRGRSKRNNDRRRGTRTRSRERSKSREPQNSPDRPARKSKNSTPESQQQPSPQKKQPPKKFETFDSDFPLPKSNSPDFPLPKSNSPRKQTSPAAKTTTTTTTSSSSSPTKSPRQSPTAATIDPKDKSFIKVFINEIISQGFRMMWYKDRSSSDPSSIMLFLQHGHKSTNGEHGGPALVWTEDREKDQFFGVNIFDIRTLDRASSKVLGEKSFAMPSRCVFIRLAKGNEFVFEAESEQEAFRFVHGMKWVIARLTFNLVIGNLDVSCELVDVGLVKSSDLSSSTRSILEEAEAARAMDDVTVQMVDKSVFRVR
jgi:hypothetical protein